MNNIIPRIFNELFERSMRSSLITVLVGPRQVGKTTTVAEFLKSVPADASLTVSLDSSFERERISRSERYLEEQIERVRGAKLATFRSRFYLFIDEAQKLPLIFERVKLLYDTHGERIKIVLSGSSALELLDTTAETLAGRVQVLRVHPFTLSERAVISGCGEGPGVSLFAQIYDLSLSGRGLAGLMEQFLPDSDRRGQIVEAAITGSSFPTALVKTDPDEMPRWTADYIDTYIERDMRSVREIGNIDAYRTVVAQLAARMGALLEYRGLAADAALSEATTKKYVGIWQESLIGQLLMPFFVNPATRIKKSRKVVFADNALAWALSGFPAHALLSASGRIGHYFENLVVNDFLKWGSVQQIPPGFHFWEKSSASEIDLVISVKGSVIPVEVKYAASWDARYLHAIDMFRQKHKNLRIPFSLIIYRGEFAMPREDVYCIPAWALC